MRQTYAYHYLEMSGMSVVHRKALGERIKFFRQSMNMSQKRLCELVESMSLEKGIKFTTADLSNYERGKYCPKIDKLTALCEATCMPAYWFAGYDLKPAELSLKKAA